MRQKFTMLSIALRGVNSIRRKIFGCLTLRVYESYDGSLAKRADSQPVGPLRDPQVGSVCVGFRSIFSD